MKTQTLGSVIVEKPTRKFISVIKCFFGIKKVRIISSILLVCSIWGITAGVGFSEVVRIKDAQTQSTSKGLIKKDWYYIKYVYSDGPLTPKVKYALGQVGNEKKTVGDFDDGIDGIIIGMKAGEKRRIATRISGTMRDVSIEILSIVEKNNYHDPDKVLEKGDIAILYFKGFLDGEAFDGGYSEYYSLKIGSKSFIKGFEDKMLGMKEGEKRDLNLKFPDDYNKASLAGEEVVFKVLLRAIVKKSAL